MKLMFPKTEILSNIDRESILKSIEIAGRTAYKSEDNITEDSASGFVSMIVKRGHLSVIEHEKATVKFYCDTGISHEMVRHRLASFTQESTRYCNYNKKGITYIEMRDHFKNPHSIKLWLDALLYIENLYNQFIENGESPQIARSILPKCLKTEIVVTANLRQWRTMFEQRCALAAHPQMRELMIPLLDKFKVILPEIYGEL